MGGFQGASVGATLNCPIACYLRNVYKHVYSNLRPLQSHAILSTVLYCAHGAQSCWHWLHHSGKSEGTQVLDSVAAQATLLQSTLFSSWHVDINTAQN